MKFDLYMITNDELIIFFTFLHYFVGEKIVFYAFMRTIVFVCISYCFTSANTKPKCWINSLTIDYKNHKIFYVYDHKVTAEPS